MASTPRLQPSFDGAALQILRRAVVAHVGVQGAQGPHVTPQSFVWFLGRLWLLTPRDSFKAKVLAKRPAVGVLLESDSRCLYLSGRAAVLDPLDPDSLRSDPMAAGLLPAAVGAYVKKNLYETISAARRRFGWDVLGMPGTRVALCVTPWRSALLGPEGLVAGDGDWTAPTPDETADVQREPDLDDLPDEVSAMAVSGRHLAVVGWGGNGAPLLMPGCWDGSEEYAEVDASLLDLAMAPSHADACVTVDNEIGPDLQAKRGVVLRGAGVARFADGKAKITLDIGKVHYWAGTDGGTLDSESDA
jgi:hypothetical protein